MTDADVDGAHIQHVAFDILYRFMPDLIREGHVYLENRHFISLRRIKRYGMHTATRNSAISLRKWDVTRTIKFRDTKVWVRWTPISYGRGPWILSSGF